MNATKELTIEDLQRTSIPEETMIDNRPAVVYRLGNFDSSAPLLGRRGKEKDVYFSHLVLCSYPPEMSIN